MQKNSMYDTLLNLPTFQGVNKEKISEIIGNFKLEFIKYLPDTEIINAGDSCSHLKFILSGEIRLSIADASQKLIVGQTIKGPDVILPDFLFGRVTRYPYSAVSISTTSILQIKKTEYLKILRSEPIFLMNFLNLVSMDAQTAVEGGLAVTRGDISKRIAFTTVALTQPSARDIVLHSTEGDMASVFGTDKASLSTAMAELGDRGYLDFDNDSIRIKDRRSLMNLILSEN